MSNNENDKIKEFSEKLSETLYSSLEPKKFLEHFVNAILLDVEYPTIKILRIEKPSDLENDIRSTSMLPDIKLIAYETSANGNGNGNGNGSDDNSVNTGHKKEILVIIEFQCYKEDDYAGGLLEYTARCTIDQVPDGDYTKMKKMVFITFVDDATKIFGEDGKSHSILGLFDSRNRNLTLDVFRHHVLDINEFDKILKNATIDDSIKKEILACL